MSALDDVIRYHDDNCQSGSECDLSALSRAEFAQLRATVAEQAQRIARIDADNRQLISEYKTLEDRFAEQARQLAEARYLIEISLSTTLERFDDFNFDAFREAYGREHSAREFVNSLRTWLAAYPAPQADEAQ